ncbi:3-oxoacyl-[acyl-carrier-protein] synthase III C-terminal domain-containing protein [Streptomyces sp. DG2A-72]|uniref:3-oxoacyl-ACP synthase III family protein n=1 Tax=Streptomyces sp. DG2A-72 TaxID=3051386 RepID=UPI00265BE8CE|nr:3-oxoacyl-[acyl-carrier-protein] synthase III C-terminal domain-containing protein [Streptomyces sp. DG2A-72]MDO0937277.1 3-oxoacyl-[acyl-carrier-protein] synthase III C-terminal domain-containing protein [Streptomyces sp. DG2A-72]
MSQSTQSPRPSDFPDRHVSVLATGAHLPGDPIDNDTLARLAGPLPEDVLEGIQVRRRHWMADPATGEHRTSTSKMATAAARQALERAGVEAAEIDLIVLSTASPDHLLPVAGTYVQEQLGLEQAAVIEVRAGCVGAVQAFDIARRLLADGTYRTALVIGAESVSPLLVPFYLGQDPDRVRMRDRLTVYTFGDGAGAAVLRAGAEGSAEGRLRPVFATRSMGGARKPGMLILGGGTDVPLAQQQARKRLMDIKLDIPGTAQFGPKVFVEGIHDMLRRSGLALGDIDACVLPEGNAEYFSSEYGTAGLSAEDQATLSKTIVENLTDVGATGSAAVPLALDAGWSGGRIQPGDTVLLLAIEASRYVYAGLTLTWEAATPAQ